MRNDVPELPQAVVAVETQDATNPTGGMIVVHMLRPGRPADRARPTLGAEYQVGFPGRKPAPTFEVAITGSASWHGDYRPVAAAGESL